MFTGLIEAVGHVRSIDPLEAGFSLRIATALSRELTAGESVSVNGVCLTVVDAGEAEWIAEIGPETAAVTALGALEPGALVNLERAMRADGRFGGHLVLGHVDGTGTILDIRPEAAFSWIVVGYSRALAPYLIHRGSIAVDGISLTVARLNPASFDVQIVPFTLAHTSLHAARRGDRVNLECDMVGKYVLRAVELLSARGDEAGTAGDLYERATENR